MSECVPGQFRSVSSIKAIFDLYLAYFIIQSEPKILRLVCLPATVWLPEGDDAEDDLSAVHIAGGQPATAVPVTAVSHDVPGDRE